MYLADNLRAIREDLGLTQTELASIIGATRTMIFSYELGRAKPKPLILKKIALLAGVEIDDLVNKKLNYEDLSGKVSEVKVLLLWVRLNKMAELYRQLVGEKAQLTKEVKKNKDNQENKKLLDDASSKMIVVDKELMALSKEFMYALADISPLVDLDSEDSVDFVMGLIEKGYFELIEFIRQKPEIPVETKDDTPQEVISWIQKIDEIHASQAKIIDLLTYLTQEISFLKSLK